ncbi:MAG: hypothetical protein GTO45_14780 [Candidatus Aminicenantes bacterium]|nr:hypothetical protein [Candidatus Aminicenantes bacterium]NIM80019.1 hypothetical protein [Candidatus Aminicenantes bacterium]NIN19373.1 hypothetical protein [Candidatus Aminicenantes bacterium]NIN43272.1 hypothetical protein [Candidatus Aminicenantes bacterium]NIN86014.1 hypothetical protein [Candidatus Aminicenantes bacterium]
MSQTGLSAIHLDIPLEKTPVSRFITPRQRCELYPGTRPAWSFCFIGEYILPIRAANGLLEVKDESNQWQNLEHVVSERTGIPFSHRFAVLAVGSNACPARLADPDKYGNFQTTAIPVLHGWINDVVSVYTPWTASYQSVPATVMGLTGARSKLWVTLLTENELQQMDRSEGRGISYGLVELPHPAIQFSIEEGVRIFPISAYCEYASVGLCLKDSEPGIPILLDCFEVAGADLPRMSQEEVREAISRVTGDHLSLEEKNRLLLRDYSVPIAIPTGSRKLDGFSFPSQYSSLNIKHY